MPASSHCVVTKMKIYCEDLHKWPIIAERAEGLRCIDIFEAIYKTFAVPLTAEDMDDYTPEFLSSCIPAFEQRCKDGPGLTEVSEARGLCRVDILKTQKIFKSISKKGREPAWTLKLDRPLDRPQGSKSALASGSTVVDNRASSRQEGPVFRRLTSFEEEVPPENKPSSFQSRNPRYVTADLASSHVNLLEPFLRMGLASAAFEGQYIIQVGFNETALQQGVLLEEIHLLLDGNLRLEKNDICTIFAPTFAPFPGIIYTPGETFYVPIDPPSQGYPGRRLELQGSQSSHRNSGTTAGGQGSSGSAGKGSENQNKKSAKGDTRAHRKMPGRWPDPGDVPSDDDDEGDSSTGKKKESGAGKGKGRQRGPRVINIPFQSTLLTTGLDGKCDQFTMSASVDITVRLSKSQLR